MKLIGYLRVSTREQAESGLGLDIQESAIRAWARQERHRLVAIHKDEGVSGSNGLDSRTGLLECLDAIKDGTGSGIIVYRLDRLARDLIVQEQILAEVRRLGGQVFSTSAAESGYLEDDPRDPSRKLIRQVLGAVAEYERSMIALRMRAGRQRKADRGGYAYGAPPYGYRAHGGELVEDEAEQAVVQRILGLRQHGASLRQIVADLESAGITPRRGRWHPDTVAAVLRQAEKRG